MRSFKDKDGRVWDVEVTWGTIKRVLARTGVDLSIPFHEETVDGEKRLTSCLDRFKDDNLALLQALHAALPAAPPEDEFLSLLDGPAGLAAADAFLEALADFTPRPWQTVMRRALAESARARETLSEQAEAALSAMPSTSSPGSSG